MGKDLNYFRFDSDDTSATEVFAAAYGPQPKSLKVLLPFPTVEQNFQAWMEEYTASGLQRRCDGENQAFHRDERGTGITIPVQCNRICGKACACKQIGRLYLLIPELARLAYVVMETHSIYDIVQLTENLQAAFALRGNLSGVPFILSRREREISTPSKEPGKRFRTKKSLLFIEPDPEWVQRKLIAMRSEAFAMLPEVSSAIAPPATPANVDRDTGEILIDGDYADEDEAPPADNPFADPLAGATPASERLQAKINIIFNGQAAIAAAWLVEGYTRQKTPDSIRTAIAALSPDECDLIADSLVKNGEKIKAKFVEYQQSAHTEAGA